MCACPGECACGPKSSKFNFFASGGRFYNKISPEIQVKFRTECWLERCLSDGKVWEVHEHPLFIPITIPRPLVFTGSKPFVVCWSGLDDEQVMWSKRVAGALGECFHRPIRGITVRMPILEIANTGNMPHFMTVITYRPTILILITSASHRGCMIPITILVGVKCTYPSIRG